MKNCKLLWSKICWIDPSLDENETIKDVMHQESVVAFDVKKVRIYAQQINHLIGKEEPGTLI